MPLHRTASTPILAACVAAALVGVPSVARGQVPNNPPQPPPQQPAPPAAQQPSPILTTGQRLAVARPQQSAAAATLSQTISAAVGLRLAPFGAPAPITTGGAPRAAYASLDGAQAGASPLWGVFVGPSATWSDRDDGVFGFDGVQLGITAGIDRRIGDRAVLGVLALGDRSEIDTVGGVRLEGASAGLGVYAGASLGDVLVIDGYVARQGGETALREPLARADFATSRWLAAANLSAYLYAGALQVTPTLGVDWVRERQSAYVDSAGAAAPGFTTQTATVRGGVELARDIALPAVVLTPFASATAFYDVLREESLTAAATDDLSRFDVSLAAGLRAAPSETTSLSLRLEASGLARGDYSVLTASGQVSWRF